MNELSGAFNREYLDHILYYSDKRLSFGESDLEEFRKDMDASKTGRKTFKERKVQRYKTWKECDVFTEYSPDIILSKYAGSTHPLINATIANALINSGQYEKGLSFLFDALLYSTRFPNYYWHSEYGMLGCSHALWTLAMLISQKNNCHGISDSLDWEKIEYQVNELLYMTMTRTIDMAPDLPQTCDLLVNRADLFWPHYDIGFLIFMNAGFGATMEVQFLSDKYRAFRRASQIDLSLGGLYKQMSNEARMMYQYGTLHPIYTDTSPKEIEDATFEELVERGYRRGDVVALKAYERFSQNKLGFTMDELEEIIISLRQYFPNISSKEIFIQLFHILEDSFNRKNEISPQKIIDTLDSVKAKYGNQQAYKQIYSCACKLLNYKNVNCRNFLRHIINEYKKVEKNYDFDKGITEFPSWDSYLVK